MTTSTAETSPLLPQGASVVQLRTETDLERVACTGRVEHVVSGQTTHFQSLEGLLAFMAQVLATARRHRRSAPERDVGEPAARSRRGPMKVGKPRQCRTGTGED